MVTKLLDKSFKNGNELLISKTDDVWTENGAEIFFLIERIRKEYGTVWGIVLWRLSITIGILAKQPKR